MNLVEKKALFRCHSREAVLEAFRFDRPKELEIDIVDSVGQKPKRVNWIQIQSITHGGFTNAMTVEGACDVEYGTELFGHFSMRYDPDLKSGIIKFGA